MNPELPTSSGPELPLPPRPPSPPAPPKPALRRDLARLLKDFRAHQRRELWTEAALYAVGAATVLLIGAGFLAKLSPMTGRAAAVLTPIAFLGLLGFLGAFRSRRQIGDDPRIARSVGEKTGLLGEDALSAVELRAQPDADTRFSPELLRAFLDDVDQRAARVDPSTLIDTRPSKRAGAALLAALLACTVAVGLWRTPWKAGWKALVTVGEAAKVATRFEPITGDIELTYRYPAYTGLAPRTVTGTNGEISAPAGTEVELSTRSDRKVSRAEAVVNGAVVPLEVQNERDLRGRFIVEKPGSYHVRFIGRLGREADRGPETPIRVEADAAPKVELQLPQQEVEIDPGEKVTLRYEATDDYGLAGLELVFRLPGGQEQRVALPREDGRATRRTWSWDVGSLKVKPGDRISYFVEARDNDAVAGEKRGVSRTQVVRIYSAAEHRREALRQAEKLWDRMILQLADRLEGPDLERALDVEKVKRGQSMDDAGAVLAQDLLGLAHELSSQRDAPPELVNALVNIADGYGKRVQTTRETRRMFLRFISRKGLSDEFGLRLTSVVSEEVEELEKDILYLESLIDRRKLEELRELAKEMDAQRRELSSLIEDYQKTQDPNLREEILQQINALRERIEELSQRMSELARGIRDEHLNAEAMKELMKEQDMSSALDEVERLMREGKADEALKKLQELALQMEQMMKNLEQADQDFGGEQFPELAKKFGEFMEDLQQTGDAQRKVAEDTKEIRDRYREKMRERLQRKGEALKDELRKKVEQAQKGYEGVEPERLGFRAEVPLQELRTELENIEQALAVEDYDLAAQSAARAERAAEQLGMQGQHQAEMDKHFGNPPEVQQESRKLAEKLDQNGQTVREVNQALQQLFPPAGSMMSQEDQKKMRELAEQQDGLQQRAQQLQQQMDEMSKMAPLFDEKATEQMEQIGERMGEASRRMQGRDPARGYGEQQAALQQLQQFQQQMQEGRQQGQGGGLPLPMMSGRRQGMGGSSSQEKVEIPDEDQYQAPKEFRKDILDAMKQGAPEKYKDQVKRYYEELVR